MLGDSSPLTRLLVLRQVATSKQAERRVQITRVESFLHSLFFALSKIILNFVVQSVRLQAYYIDESVLAFVLERKCGSFQNTRRATHSSPCIWCYGTFVALHLNTGVGYCLFVFGSFHNLRSDKLIGLTLSFYTNRTFGAGAQT